MPHLNELQAQFGGKGLTILGVTSESKKDTEPWIEEKGVTYPWGYDEGGEMSKGFGVSGIPAAFLIDAGGRIVWQGHPASLREGTIEDALKDSYKALTRDWPKSAKAVGKALTKGDLGDALAKAEALAVDDEFGKELVGRVKGRIRLKVTSVESAFAEGDVLVAYESGKAIQKSLKGLPEQERIDSIIKQISKDKDLKERMKQLEKLRKIVSVEMDKKKQCDEVAAKLEKFLKGNEGTYVGDRIEAKLKAIRKVRGKLSH